MGITQQIGASSLIKPGVIDSAATRPASPYEGQVVFQKDTDQLLVWNGTAWVIPNSPAQNPQGLEYITSTALSGSSTVISNCFSATYDSYRCVLSNFQSTASWPGVRLGTTATGYYFGGCTAQYSTGNFVGAFNGANVGSFEAGMSQSSPSSITGGGFFELYNPFLTTETSFHASVNYLTTVGYGGVVSGFQNSDTSFTSMTIFGTSMSGTLRIYGYRQA